MPGLTSAGLEIATLADVRAQINAAWRGFFGASMDVSDRSPDGQLIGIAAEAFALFWELLEAINSSQDPDKATGAALRALAALTATTPSAATFSTVTLTLTGTPTTVVTTGSLVSTASTGQQFTTTASATIAAATAWASSTAYLAGDRRTNSSNVYLCITPGTSASSGGPTTTAADITDGTAHWRFLGAGTGAVDVIARATVSGPIVAVSGDLVNRDTPVGGWNGAINVLDAALGADAMTDAQLRVLRENELAQPGTGPADAISAAMLKVGANTLTPVTNCTVFANTGDTTDGDGVGPHQVEVLVRGGVDQDIFDALRVNVPAGILTHGTTTGTSVDSSGVAQPMAFTRRTDILIYVSVTLVKDPNAYPADGDAQVALAIATAGNARDDGTNVTASWVSAQVFKVPGLIEVPTLPLIGTAPGPTLSTTIAITTRQGAFFDTSRIVVASSDGVP